MSAWPLISDFSRMLQNPKMAFRDPALKDCTVEKSNLGQPKPRSGNFATVYRGYRPDGSMVTTDVTTDGIIDGTGPLADFQTFNFQGFTGLSRVEIPTYGWSLDNLQVSFNVPEPASAALLLAGGSLLCALRRRRPA